MYAFAAYAAVAVIGALSAQALRPRDALALPHHRRIYWIGAGAAFVLAGLCSGVILR